MNQDTEGRDAILASIEKRWEKSDQEVFVAALLVNPFYRVQPFATLDRFSLANINALFRRLYLRFFKEEPPAQFITHLSDFLDGIGYFSKLGDQVRYELEAALQQVCAYVINLTITRILTTIL